MPMESVACANHTNSWAMYWRCADALVVNEARCFLANLLSETSATFVAAALQNETAGTARHTLQETVYFGAVDFFRLESSLRHNNSINN